MAVTINKSPGDLAQALARARELKPRLDAAADELNRAIEAVEAALVNLQLGVRASVVMDVNKEEYWSRELTFGKESRTWRLLIEEGFNDPEIPNSVIPLVNASREIRLRAAEMIPTLVKEMVATAEREIRRVEAAAETARKVEAALASGAAK